MVMILDRQQFADHIESRTPGLADRQSPLWIPEQHYEARFVWFLRLPTFAKPDPEFWIFNRECLTGKVACFSSGLDTDTGESWDWWGFTNQDDIPVFILRWS